MKTFSEVTKQRMAIAARKRCTPEWRKRQSESMVTPISKSEVEHLYSQNLTQDEIAKRLGVTQKIVWGFMKRHGMKARVAAKRDQRGEKNHLWKGSSAGYVACHQRLQRIRGAPSKCEVCDTTKAKSFEWANLTGNFADVNDYKRMCGSCHARHDNKVKNFVGKVNPHA